MLPQITQFPILNIFSELLAIPSPSGCEAKLGMFISSKLESLGYAPKTDAIGNVYVELEGKDPQAPLCIIAAHIDEIGVVVTNIEANGNLKVSKSGGLAPNKLGERPLEFLGDKKNIIGVSALGSGHTLKVKKEAKTWNDVSIITGLSPQQLKEAGVRPGTCGVPVRSECGPHIFGDPQRPMAAAWTFDDRMGAAILIRLLEVLKQENNQPQRPTVIAFTTREEVGAQGAKVLANNLKPETFISIDGSPIPPGAPLSLDGRPAIWSKDSYGHYDQDLTRFIINCAQEAGTEIQPVVYDVAASDAAMLQASGLAARIAEFGHVRENSHGYEVTRVEVFENTFKTLKKFIETWRGE